MKLSLNIFKIILAVIVIAGVILWSVDSIRAHSYSGANLSFDVAGGIIIVTNPSDNPVAAQLMSSGYRTFRISSTVEGITGSSTRIGTGSNRIQQFEFELPPGIMEFTVSGGTDVRFIAETDAELQATVNPMSSDSRRNVLITAAVVVVGALFYISNLTAHQWIKSLRNKILPSTQDTSKQDTKPIPVAISSGQGRAIRSYGDNRADIEGNRDQVDDK